MKKMYEIKTEVLSQVKVGPGIYHLKFMAPDIAGAARPGQFLNISCGYRYDPLLRRPLTIYKAHTVGKEQGLVEVIYKVVGRGTELLSQKKQGDSLEVLGPLGNGFNVDKTLSRYILVSGGLGVASLMTLARELSLNSAKPTPYIYLLIGSHTPEELICVEDFKALGDSIEVVTWVNRANLHDSIEDLLTRLNAEGTDINNCVMYACGPRPMLKWLAKFAQRNNLDSFVSLEAHMACGVGACQSCICNVVEQNCSIQEEASPYRYKLVCKDGPVFNAREVFVE